MLWLRCVEKPLLLDTGESEMRCNSAKCETRAAREVDASTPVYGLLVPFVCLSPSILLPIRDTLQVIPLRLDPSIRYPSIHACDH